MACVAPMSTPATTQAPGLRASRDGGRPPVETPPYGITRPSRISTSIRAAIVDRASPVASASWARVRGCPSRRRSKTSLVRTAEVNHAQLLNVQQTTFAELSTEVRDACHSGAVTQPASTPSATGRTPSGLRGEPAQTEPEVVLRARGLTKSFVGHTVLEDVDLELRAGQVHGLVGENGAGKSTLMKILAGVHQADARHRRARRRARSRSATRSRRSRPGCRRSSRSSTCCPSAPSPRTSTSAASRAAAAWSTSTRCTARRRRCSTTSASTGLRATQRVRPLSVAEQQIVEIAKAVSYDARIISMDEPTAALADHEVELLYAIIERLTARGVAILYVSHRLKEIFDLCDTITVLKDGRQVTTRPAAELDDAELVRLMVGRSISSFFPDPVEGTEVGEPRLELRGAGNGYVDGIDLTLRAGEIVGVAGLQGSGRTELLEAVFGIRPFTRGTMTVGDRSVRPRSPRAAIRAGLAMITEDRKATGLALNQSILDNALGVVRAVFPRRTGGARREAPGLLSSLAVSARAMDQEVQFLSGGNQQKVVLARWLTTRPRVVLMDEPTRGIDVGAKHAIYELMRSLAAEGVAVLMVSSELPEVIGMSDRILVMRDGRLAGELPAGPTEETVLQLATGVTGRCGMRAGSAHLDRHRRHRPGAQHRDRRDADRRQRAQLLQHRQHLGHPDRAPASSASSRSGRRWSSWSAASTSRCRSSSA